jgi:hypothetical protein
MKNIQYFRLAKSEIKIVNEELNTANMINFLLTRINLYYMFGAQINQEKCF